MKTPKLAIIDDGISPAFIPKGQIARHFAADENAIWPDKPEEGDSHGSYCYKVFRQFTQTPHHLTSIKVLNRETGTGYSQALLTALRWCAGQGIDLLHMSMGTRQYLDFASIADAVKSLPNTIIVAACSNENTLTFPACLPTVLGVRHYELAGLRGGHVYIGSPYDQIELMAYAENASNSMAAPIITAKVCGYLAQGYEGLGQIRQKLKEDAIKDTSFLSYEAYKNLLPEWEGIQVPVVALPDNIPGSIDVLKRLNAAFVREGYRAVGLSLGKEADTCAESYIFRPARWDPQIALPDLIELYYNFTLPDVLFLHMDPQKALSLPEGMAADAVIEPGWLGLDTPSLFAKIKGLLS